MTFDHVISLSVNVLSDHLLTLKQGSVSSGNM